MTTFRWEEPTYIILGIITSVLVVVMLFVYHKWQLSAGKYFLEESQNKLSNKGDKISRFYWWWTALPLVLGLAFANPQWGERSETRTVTGTDIMIAIDISSSMLARDVPPSRMERAKHFSSTMIDELFGNRIGLILFAGGAIKQSPLTTDYKILKTMVQAATPSQAAAQGTNIKDAIKLAMLKSNDDEDTAKALLLITDGETHDEDALEEVRKAAKEGISIFVVGVGTETGSPIPDPGNPYSNFKRDELGNEIISRLNVDMCRKLAAEGGGKAYILNNMEVVIDSIVEEMKKLESREIETTAYQKYNSYFFFFVILSIILLIGLSLKSKMI